MFPNTISFNIDEESSQNGVTQFFYLVTFKALVTHDIFALKIAKKDTFCQNIVVAFYNKYILTQSNIFNLHTRKKYWMKNVSLSFY